MLSQPRLSGPVSRSLLSASSSQAAAPAYSAALPGSPRQGADQSWNWWVGLPAAAADQSVCGIGPYWPSEGSEQSLDTWVWWPAESADQSRYGFSLMPWQGLVSS